MTRVPTVSDERARLGICEPLVSWLTDVTYGEMTPDNRWIYDHRHRWLQGDA